MAHHRPSPDRVTSQPNAGPSGTRPRPTEAGVLERGPEVYGEYGPAGDGRRQWSPDHGADESGWAEANQRLAVEQRACPLPDAPGQAFHFPGGLAGCLLGSGRGVGSRLALFLRFLLILVRPQKVLACLPQLPLGGGHVSSRPVVPVARPLQQRVGVRLRGAQIAQLLVGGPCRLTGPTELLLLLAAPLGDLVLGARPRRSRRGRRVGGLAGCRRPSRSYRWESPSAG